MDAIVQLLDTTKLISIAGLLISLFSLYFTAQNRRLILSQERRRQPRLLATLVHCYFHDDEAGAGRSYAFLITVTNPTDANNTIAYAELSIGYSTVEVSRMIMKLRANEGPDKFYLKGRGEPIAVPAAIAAHGAISGWLHFYVPAAALTNRQIDYYRLTLTDPHGEVAAVDPILIEEYRGAT